MGQGIEHTEITENVQLVDVFYVDPLYSKKHAHMLHKHSGVLELLYISSGSGRYIVGSREYAVEEGNLIICEADTLHGEAPFQDHSMQTYCLALTGVQLQDSHSGHMVPKGQRPILKLSSSAQVISHLMPDIYTMFHQDSINPEICSHFALGIFCFVKQLLAKQISQISLAEQKQEKLVGRITDYLNVHYTEPLTLEGISKALFISETYLSHLFKRETGLAPMQYVIHRRIGEAQSMLMETSFQIQRIGEMLGFGSSAHFTIMFKKYVGVSPKEYRRHFPVKRSAQ
jgi:AraC-like DNA-binding protein/mannose-6-phosphate isomerase-like protein (cupin superfamily)